MPLVAASHGRDPNRGIDSLATTAYRASISNVESVLYRWAWRQPRNFKQDPAYSPAAAWEGNGDARKEPGFVLAHDDDECSCENEVYE